MDDCAEADEADYHISTFSGGSGCVAVAKLPNGDYVVRHSRDHSARIVFTEREFRAFVAGVKDQQFDF